MVQAPSVKALQAVLVQMEHTQWAGVVVAVAQLDLMETLRLVVALAVQDFQILFQVLRLLTLVVVVVVSMAARAG